MNKAQAEMKFYAFHAVSRVDVNDVKRFQKPTGRLPADHFLDPQSMPRLFITTNRWLYQILLLLILFQQSTTGAGWVRAFQHDNVFDNYVGSALIKRIHTAPMK